MPLQLPAKKDKILIIDDTPDNIVLLNSLLCDDYQIFFATNGLDGLELALLNKPDLILLDIMMPGIDGYEVCRTLKRQTETSQIPVIFITALVSAEEEARGLEIGAIDYISKPVSPPIVKNRIRNHLKLKRHSDMLELLGEELTRKNRQLEVLAMQDGLTGLANRRFYDQQLDIEIRRAARNNTPLSLIFADIDFFKPYNDHYGHLAGDDCLRCVGALLQRLFRRSGDCAARYGGEEFAVILPGADADTALLMAQALVGELQAEGIPHEFSEVSVHVSMSLGVVTALRVDGKDASWFNGQADAALYLSKHDGRNRVTALPHDD